MKPNTKAMGKVISFINYKGGVGKRTTTYHIGCYLALFHNKKVLLIDTDPQTNLTFLCAIYERWRHFKKDNRFGIKDYPQKRKPILSAANSITQAYHE